MTRRERECMKKEKKLGTLATLMSCECPRVFCALLSVCVCECMSFMQTGGKQTAADSHYGPLTLAHTSSWESTDVQWINFSTYLLTLNWKDFVSVCVCGSIPTAATLPLKVEEQKVATIMSRWRCRPPFVPRSSIFVASQMSGN